MSTNTANIETEARLYQIRERERKATSGPWAWTQRILNERPLPNGRKRRLSDLWVFLLSAPSARAVDRDIMALNWAELRGYIWAGGPKPDNAAFIAHAREDIPFLLALVEEQAAEIERLTNQLDDDGVPW